MEQKTITADNDLWERVDDLAEKRGVSRSELVRKALREELQKAVKCDTEEENTTVEKHSRTVTQPSSHMDLSEHVTWLLGETTTSVGYPQFVTVTIEVEEKEAQE